MVKTLKVTFIWTKAFLEIFNYDESKQSKYFYRDYTSFLDVFERVKRQEEPKYSYPWHHLEHNNFWNSYLGYKDEKRVKPEDLWGINVPMFCKDNTKVRLKSEKYGTVKVSLEPYMYRHGLTVVMNLNIKLTKGRINIPDMAEVIKELYNSGKYEIDDTAIHKENINLKELYNTLVHKYSRDIVGELSTDDLFGKPFTIITVMDGEREKLSKEELLQQVRNIFKSVDQTYSGVIPLSRNNDPEDIYRKNLLFCSNRGRLLWYPAIFLGKSENKKSLGCYNKNIMRLSMHIESFMELLKEFMKSDNVPDKLYRFAKELQFQMVKLYFIKNKNLKQTYYSASTVAHLNDNDYLGVISLVRDRLKIASEKPEPLQMKDIFSNEPDPEDNTFF
jgi:hypothetical protein